MSGFKIGWGRREFSLNEKVSINGQAYMRISEGVMDPLYATALCLESNEGVVIFCSLDITSVRHGLYEEILDEIKVSFPAVPVEHVILNATHSHTAPDLRNVPEKSPDGVPIYPRDKVHKFISSRVAQAVNEAWENRKSGGIAYGYGYAVAAHSRRSTYLIDKGVADPLSAAPNGTTVMYGKTNDPDFAGYEAGADHFLNAMYTFDAENKLTGIIVNVPCPSQIAAQLSMLSADYWYEVREIIAKKFGKDVFVLPQCAAAGDLAPKILHYKAAQKRRFALKYGIEYDSKKLRERGEDYLKKVTAERKDIAERITNAVEEIYSWAKKDIMTDVVVCHEFIDTNLTKRQITEKEVENCENNLKAMEKLIPDKGSSTPEEYRVAITRYKTVKSKNENAISKYNDLKVNLYFPARLHAVRVGDIAFCTNKFELYMDFMHRIQARSPFIQTFVVQLAGEDSGSYLPTKCATEGKGYGASIFCNKVGPEGGAQLVEATLNMLNDLKFKE